MVDEEVIADTSATDAAVEPAATDAGAEVETMTDDEADAIFDEATKESDGQPEVKTEEKTEADTEIPAGDETPNETPEPAKAEESAAEPKPEAESEAEPAKKPEVREVAKAVADEAVTQVPAEKLAMLSGNELIEALKDEVVGKDEYGEEIKLGQFAKEYPSVLGTIEKVVAKLIEPIRQQAEAQAEAVAKNAAVAARDAARDRLEKVCPGAKDLLGSKEFSDWFYRQSQGIQGLGYSGDDNDGKTLVEIYRSQHPASAPKPPAVRKQILSAGRTTGSRTVSKNPENDELSEEEERALFDEASR